MDDMQPWLSLSAHNFFATFSGYYIHPLAIPAFRELGVPRSRNSGLGAF
jgi:hypothetical protein